MLPFKRILFPVDFSEHAVGAARYVEAFTGRFDADLTLLHVIGLPQYNDLLAESADQKRARMERFLAREFEYFRVERIVAQGDPATAILETARSRHSDLIMMPTLGAGAFRRFLIGSVTAKVLHDADCPVWTGAHLEKAPPLEKIEFRRLLCPVNLENYAKKVIAGAREFAEEYRASLTMLHVVHGADQTEQARRRMEELAGGAEIVIEPGEVPTVVANVAARVHADLVIIGRSPAPGVFGRLRTHAYPIIRQSPCPVISL
jgi:nucleotide-binding universal stress UspA family protein